MGVASCLALLKPVASRPVDLNDGRGFILYDGHACMHRAASKGEVAVRLALDNDVKALASDMLFELRTMEEKGWVVVVVFDGATPPSKVDTSNSRSSARLQALQQCRRLRAQQPINHKELEKHARKAAAFTPTVVARVSRILRHSLRADCITAPFEADAQLKVMEDNYSREGQRCFVRANDSDLIVLGVRSLLWDVKIDHDGRVFGECITRANVVRPQLQILHNSDASSAFLRRLHGMVANTPRSDRVWLSGSGEGVVMTNLRNWACVAGNDYSKFTGIGPVRALEFAMPFGATQTIDEIAASIAIDIQAPEEGVLTSLRTSIDMFLHPVVWDPTTGAHRHLSRATSSVDITSNTGASSYEYNTGYFVRNMVVVAGDVRTSYQGMFQYQVYVGLGCVIRQVRIKLPNLLLQPLSIYRPTCIVPVFGICQACTMHATAEDQDSNCHLGHTF